MKKFFILVILALGMFNFGCDKCECDTDEFYIQYAVGVLSIDSGEVIDIFYRDDNNETITLSTDTAFSIVLGPVEKGFTASLSAVTGREIGNTTLIVNILVAKNDGPFISKRYAEMVTSGIMGTEYTIDF